jgi:hypothetical protein
MQWWGYNKEHGWVVLDRRIPANIPGIKTDLLFVRCRDAAIFDVKRETWKPPLYRFAPNYLRDLAPPAAMARIRTRTPARVPRNRGAGGGGSTPGGKGPEAGGIRKEEAGRGSEGLNIRAK